MIDDIEVYNKYDSNIKEISLDIKIQEFLERNYYENYLVVNLDIEKSYDISYVKINHISYDRSKDETDINLIDFQQILSALSSKCGKFVYKIVSDENGIDLYLGTLKNSQSFLNETFMGIYSGSKTCTKDVVFDDFKHSKAMLGIPTLKRDSDKKYNQSLEKILFPLQGKNFSITIVAESYKIDTIKTIISNYQNLGNELHRLVKQSKNLSQSNANSQGITLTKGTSQSETVGESYSEGISRKNWKDKLASGSAVAVGAGAGFFIGGPLGVAIGGAIAGIGSIIFSDTETKSHSKNHSRTNSTNESQSTNQSTTKTDTIGITYEEINKSADYCEKLIDKYVERFQKGLNHGMWNTALYISSNDETTLAELEHTLKSVYSGDESYFESLRFSNDLKKNENILVEDLPMLYFDASISHPIHPSFASFTTAINTEELSILSALPNNDIDGISVSRVSSFGLTQVKSDPYASIQIGNVLNKKKPTNQRFTLSLDSLNSHLFISGITGSGKSNTTKLILKELQSKRLESKIPFLVIEPAKSEYKHLLSEMADLQIFRLGAKDDIFKLNPFVFEPSKNNTLTKHVDMLKTTFCSAFPMYGPMPYILEEALHNVYKKKGWDFENENNPYFTQSSGADEERKSLLFPNMDDLKNEIESVVSEAGYAGEVDSNIKAALKTRIKNLTMGIKGKIFNSRHAFNSNILFTKPTIIELSNIVDDEEKSFVMGLLLNKLYQYAEECGSSKTLRHLTIIEEAHRLLPNLSFNSNSEEANSRAKAVETFTNILAEIRSFGEGIIVADQIASKLHPDVIKNTNIKIIQRTMDKEDRILVGNAINLNDEQILDIAELKTGEAIVHNKDVHQAFMVKIDEYKGEKITDKELNGFYEKFLDYNNKYMYELYYESRFYLKNHANLSSLNISILKIKLINLLNTVLLNKSDILNEFKNFKNSLGYIKDEKNIYYLSSYLFKKLNYISNMQYYKNVDCFLDVNKNFIRLIDELLRNGELLDERISEFKKSFLHENINTIYPSMKYFKNDKTDFTLLLLENLVANEEFYELINKTMKKDEPLNCKLDKILTTAFNITNEELRFCLGAIRAGKQEIDFSSIIKKGF